MAAIIGLLEWRSVEPANNNVLTISDAQRAFVREQVLQAGSQGASSASYEQALNTYIEEEMLYREGLKLSLDKDDLIIKRRVVQKMRFLLEDMTPIAPPTDEQLQAWLSQHPERYQTEQTVLFDHHFFSRGKRGDAAVYEASAARDALTLGNAVLSDPFPLQALVTVVTKEQVAREIGTPASNTLFELPFNEWSPPVQSALGVHLFKVKERHAGRTMTVKEAGGQLRSDLIAAQREAVNSAGLAALRATYTIEETQ